MHLEASVHQIAVRRDPGRLDQVLDNLLSNALDVAPRGTAVRVSARPMGARVELEVRDSGPGMTPDQRARAFDRFWRSSGSRRTDRGFGLGLPIVRRIVLADGGDVRLEDAPAVGSPSWCPCPRRAPSSAPPPDALTD